MFAMGQTVTSTLLKNADSELKQLMAWHSPVHSNEQQLQAWWERSRQQQCQDEDLC